MISRAAVTTRAGPSESDCSDMGRAMEGTDANRPAIGEVPCNCQHLYRGRLIRRYKRFLADVALDDGHEITHCPNPGPCWGQPAGRGGVASKSDNPKRKLAYTFELIEIDGRLVGINTGHPNAIVAEAIAADKVPALSGYAGLRREVKCSENSRIDILLEDPARALLCRNQERSFKGDGPNPGAAEFPDSVTTRGAKHLDELATMVAAGHRAVMVYLVQRMDCTRFAAVDPGYDRAYRRAQAAG